MEYSKITVVNMREISKAEKEDEENYLYIGRPSKWQNPFPINKKAKDKMAERERVINEYKKHLWEQIKKGEITREDLLELRGKNLICWCAPLPCHGDVIRNAVDWALNNNPEKIEEIINKAKNKPKRKLS